MKPQWMMKYLGENEPVHYDSKVDRVPQAAHSPPAREGNPAPRWRSAGSNALELLQRDSRSPVPRSDFSYEQRPGVRLHGTSRRTPRRSKTARTCSSSSSLPSDIGLRSVKGAGKAASGGAPVHQPAAALPPVPENDRGEAAPRPGSLERSPSPSASATSSASERKTVADPQVDSGRGPPHASTVSGVHSEARALQKQQRKAERRRKRRARARRAKGQARLDEIQARVAAASSQGCPPPAAPHQEVVFSGTWTTVFTMDSPAIRPGPPTR